MLAAYRKDKKSITVAWKLVGGDHNTIAQNAQIVELYIAAPKKFAEFKECIEESTRLVILLENVLMPSVSTHMLTAKFSHLRNYRNWCLLENRTFKLLEAKLNVKCLWNIYLRVRLNPWFFIYLFFTILEVKANVAVFTGYIICLNI